MMKLLAVAATAALIGAACTLVASLSLEPRNYNIFDLGGQRKPSLIIIIPYSQQLSIYPVEMRPVTLLSSLIHLQVIIKLITRGAA